MTQRSGGPITRRRLVDPAPAEDNAPVRSRLPPRALLLALTTTSLAAPGCRNRTPEPVIPPTVEAPTTTDRQLTHPAAPVTVRVPESWRDELEEAAITLISPDDEVIMIMLAIDAEDLEESLKTLNAELGVIVKKAEIDEIEEAEIHGMAAMVADGRGSLNAQPVELGLVLLRAPNGRILMVVGVALADASEDNKGDAAAILASFEPAA